MCHMNVIRSTRQAVRLRSSRVRTLRAQCALLSMAAGTLPLAAQAPVPPAGSPSAAWWSHVQVLAHDSLKGRDTGSPGHESAARYVAEQFRALGLQPGGTDGWFQRVGFVQTRLDEANVSLALRSGTTWEPLTPGRDLRLTARLANANVEAPLVFVGYGLSLPEAGIDELAGLDLAGKIVVHVNAAPPGLPAPLLAHGTRSRWIAMQRAGAVGILAVGAGGAWSDDGSSRAGSTMALADTSLDDTRGQRIGGTLNPALMPRLLAGSGLDWSDITARVRAGESLPRAALTVSLRATLPTIKRELTSPNVVAILPGVDASLRDEVIVLSAHLDHVGTFAGPVLTGDSIFNGAMDNASGAATLIETARAIVAAGGNRRTIAFVAVTAEEKGLLGSRFFAAKPSLASGRIVANLNTDMFLPLIPLRGVFVYGFEESDLADNVETVVRARGLEVIPDPEPEQVRFVRSDQYSFIRMGIPALAFKVGYKPGTPEETTWSAWVRDHYHKLSDDVTQPVDFDAAAGFNAMYAELALQVANRETTPAWRADSFFNRPTIVP